MINPMNRSTPIRMMGMASGMDTDFIIQNAMRAHQFRIDQRVRQRTLIEWRQQTHNSIGDQLRDFQRTMLSMNSPRSMFASNNFNTHVANLTGRTGNAVSITTAANSTMGNFSILGATRASGAGITSGSRVSASSAGIALSTRLGDMALSGDQLSFRNDRMSMGFRVEVDDVDSNGDPITRTETRNFTFERVWTGPGLQGTDPNSFEFHLVDSNGNAVLDEDGEAIILQDSDFSPDDYFARGAASFTVNGETFEVTRSTNGILQRIDRDVRAAVSFTNNVANYSFGQGDALQQVRVNRTGTAATGFTYTFQVRNGGTGDWVDMDRLRGMDGDFVNALNERFTDPEQRDVIEGLLGEHLSDDGVLNQTAFLATIERMATGTDSVFDADDLAAINNLISEHGDEHFTLAGLNEGNSLRFTETRNAAGNVSGLMRIADRAAAPDSFQWGEIEPIEITVNVNGEDVTTRITGIDRNSTLNQLITAINTQMNGRATISYDQITDRFTIQSNQIGENSTISVSGLDALGLGRDTGIATAGSTSSVTIMTGEGDNTEIVTLQGNNNGTSNAVNFGGVTININQTFNAGTFNEIREPFVTRTNNYSDVFNNAAAVAAVMGHFAEGSSGDIEIRSILGSDGILEDGVLNQAAFLAAVEESTVFEQGDFEAIEGLVAGSYDRVVTSVTETVNEAGFHAALQAHFNAEVNLNSRVNVEISRNIDQAFENITEFINSYNAIISRIEGLLRERKTPAERSYLPLTDEEKQHMTERQIEQWEEIARRGIMRGDHALENLTRELRSSFFETIEGLGVRPSDIGLTTGDFFGGTGGQIIINEERLRAALEEDPDRVMAIFTQRGETRAEQGLVTRINETINNFIGASGAAGTHRNTLNALERSIRNVNDQIERMTIRMFAEEDRLFRQFAAMERAMSQLQSQGDWFNSMLGAMN